MATTPKTSQGGTTHRSASDDQLRRDRITAVIVLLIVGILMALTIWLASFGNGGVQTYDYWPMMP